VPHGGSWCAWLGSSYQIWWYDIQHIYVCIGIYTYLYLYVFTYIHINIYMFIDIFLYMCTYTGRVPHGGSWCECLVGSYRVHAKNLMHIFRYVNIYLLICMNQHIHSKYIHIYIYTRRPCRA